MRGKKKRRWGYLALVVVVIAGLVVMKSRRGDSDEPKIITDKVVRGTVTSTVSANGILQPLTTVEVKSNTGGQVVKLAVDEGDTVKPGQLIARIDPTDSLTALEQNQADLAAATSKVNQAKQQMTMQRLQNAAQVRSAEQALETARTKLLQAQEQAQLQPKLTAAAISQAKSSLAAAEAGIAQTRTATIPQKLASAKAACDQAKASYNAASRDYDRQKQLLSKGFVSKGVVDSAEEKFSVSKAQLDSAQRKLDTIKDETDQDLLSAQAKVNQAKAELENATANQVQVKVKQQEVASAQAAVKQAEAALQVAVAATQQDAIRQGDIIQANAGVKRSQAAVRNASTQLNYTTVVAPRAGIVTKKYVEEGSIVTAGRSSSLSGTGSGVAIVDIADISRMNALVNVDETDIAQIEVGQAVDITIEAYPDEPFEGKVTKIAPQTVADQNVTTVPVTVEVDLPDQRLKPGMNVTCDFIADRREGVLTVPNEAVKESDDGNTVTVLVGGKDGKQVVRKVEVGLAGRDTTEIIKGLKEGEEVVTAVIEPASARQSSGGQGGSGGMRGMGGPGGPGGMGGGGFRR